MIIDISKKLETNTPVWPGDTQVQITTMLSLSSGGMVNLTSLTMSAHTASHADAPYHVDEVGETIDQVDLSAYWGLAQVVSVSRTEGELTLEDFAGYDLSLAPRLLVRTPLHRLPVDRLYEYYPYPGPALAAYLSDKGIILYGTDAPSMDAFDSERLPGHRALIAARIAILEGLDLRLAEDGVYELSALPLRITGGDGSPVRAALRRLNGGD